MGQSATQAVTTAIDSCTGRIVDFVVENKVCSKASRLRQQDHTVVCAHNSTDHQCSATLSPSENIREGDMNTRLAQQLLDKGLTPITITSDNDGQAAKNYAALVNSTPQRGPVVAQSDPCHLGNSQVRAIERFTFQKETFGCTKLKTVNVLYRLLAKDIR